MQWIPMKMPVNGAGGRLMLLESESVKVKEEDALVARYIHGAIPAQHRTCTTVMIDLYDI